MSGSQEEELRNENQALRARINQVDAANQPLIDIQRQNALAAEQRIAKFNAGQGEVLPGTIRDFDIAEKELEEKFRRSGTVGSSAHIKAQNDFRQKKAEALAAIREGRITNEQQTATASANRLANSLGTRRGSSSDILASLSSGVGQSGFSRRNLANSFFKGVGGTVADNIGSKGVNAAFKGIGKVGGSVLSSIFGKKKRSRSSSNRVFHI